MFFALDLIPFFDSLALPRNREERATKNAPRIPYR